MITYNTYQREDGTQCTAIQFHGNAYEETGPAHVFEIMEILKAAGLDSFWVDAEETDEWEMEKVGDRLYPVLDENDDPIKKVIPEHIETIQNKDKMFVGDYIVMRDGDTYVQDGRTFEAVWTLISTELQDLGEFLQARRELEA